MDKGFVKRYMNVFLESNPYVRISDVDLREAISEAFAIHLVNDEEVVQKYTDVFLEGNPHVTIADEDLRELLSGLFAGHLVNGWDMAEDAKAELAKRGVSI